MYQLPSFVRRLTAVTFLVAYLGMFAGQAFCTGSRDPFARDGVAACCRGGACPGMAKAAANAKKEKGQPGPDCNKRGIARLLAAQAAPQGHSVGAPALALLPAGAVAVAFPRFTGWQQAQKVALVPTRHLKPKIPDIRIFIQSLTV